MRTVTWKQFLKIVRDAEQINPNARTSDAYAALAFSMLNKYPETVVRRAWVIKVAEKRRVPSLSSVALKALLINEHFRNRAFQGPTFELHEWAYDEALSPIFTTFSN